MEPYLRAAWISSFATVRTQAERLPPLMLSISKRRVSKWKPLEWIWAYNSVAVATVERRRRKSLIGLIMSLLAFFWWLLAKATKGCVCEKAAKEKRLKRPADEQELRFKFCYCCCVRCGDSFRENSVLSFTDLLIWKISKVLDPF